MKELYWDYHEHCQLFIGRVSLETVTPLSIATGTADGVFDVTLVRDANGLPTLPGTSLAGVLRHLYASLCKDTPQQDEPQGADLLFGYQDRGHGQRSLVQVSWGALQDSAGQPVEGLLLDAKWLQDPLLKAALAPSNRDRVRLTHRGVAANTGKFDRQVLPAGYRFSVELSLWSQQADDPRWQQVLNLLQHPVFRLGGGTRSGLGRLKPVAVHVGHFDLKSAAGRKAFAQLPRGLGATVGLQPLKLQVPDTVGRYLTATLTLKPQAFWRIGQGDTPQKWDSSGKPADLLPKLETRVAWNSGEASFQMQNLLIPASSIKGALAHRVAFHANRLQGVWAEDVADLAHWEKEEDCEPVQELFGMARNDAITGDNEIAGEIGRVILDDAYLPVLNTDLKLMMHNAIDRFTGGVRDHMLFMEELAWKQEICLNLTLDTQGIGPVARQALRLALDDLCQGRLAIGGGAAKGHGFCTGRIAWHDNGYWLNAPVAQTEAA